MGNGGENVGNQVGLRGIKARMQGIGVVMWETWVGMQGIRVGMWEIMVGMQGIKMEMRGIRVGMRVISVILRENLRVYCFD